MFLSFSFKMKKDAIILKFPRFSCAKNSYDPSIFTLFIVVYNTIAKRKQARLH
jgi:hypothetical protein